MSVNFESKQSKGLQKWKCPLCGKYFTTEVGKDKHMTVDCKQPEAPEREHATRSVEKPKGGSSPRKQSVLLAWIKQVQTGEREIYFFNKSGNMFVLEHKPQNSNDSGKAKFECQCEMELGEQEGSLNISDSGVYEVKPFNIQRQEGKQFKVVLRTVGTDTHKAVPDLVKNQPVADSYSQTGISKQTLKELEKYKTEIELLKQQHAAETAQLREREDKHKQTISQLKGRIANKEKLVSYKVEELKSLEEEMGRFSEKSHQVFDKYSEDRSKFDESEALLAELRKELEHQKALVTNLQRGKQALQEENAILVNQQQQLESEIAVLKSQMESLTEHGSLTRNDLEKKQRNTDAQSVGTAERVSSMNSRIADLQMELSMKQQLIEQLSKRPADSDYKIMRHNNSQLEKELKQLKLQLSKIRAAAPGSFNTGNQSGMTYSEATTSSSKEFHEDIQELNMNLSLKTRECDDLEKEVSSLKTELKGAQELLASKLDVASQFAATESERDVCEVSVSLGHELKRPTGQAMRRQHSDTRDIDRVRQLEQQLSDKNKNNKTLQTLIEQKMQENNVLRENLNNSMKELEKYSKLSAQSKPDSNLQSAGNYASKPLSQGISGKRKQSGPPSSAAVHIQHKYKLTDIWLNGKYSKFYSLNQVEKPEDLVGDLALCKPKRTVCYVIGTIKVIIPGRYEHDKTIAGIEFLDPLGDSNGEYRNTLYFNAERKHAIFLPVNEVYISYHDPKMTDLV